MEINLTKTLQSFNFRHLYYFFCIASEGSIAKAAEKLRISRSSLSIQLSQFEAFLKIPLFNRVKKKLVLTNQGSIAFQYAKEVFRLSYEMTASINGAQSVERRLFRVGVAHPVPKHITLKLTDFIALCFEDIALSVVESDIASLVDLIQQQKIDLILSDLQPSAITTHGLLVRQIASLPVIVCGTKKFSHLRKNFPHSLKNQKFIMPGQLNQMRLNVERYFHQKNIEIDVAFEVQESSLLKLLGSHGAGLFPVVGEAAKEMIERGQIIKIGKLAEIHQDFWLTRSNSPLSSRQLMQIFRDFSF